MKDLKPCPFCGEKAIIVDKNLYPHWTRYYPTCTNRSCIGRNRSKYFPSEEAARKAWNVRRPDCSIANHDATGCLGFGKGLYDDEPAEPCIRCKEYTGNKAGDME